MHSNRYLEFQIFEYLLLEISTLLIIFKLLFSDLFKSSSAGWPAPVCQHQALLCSQLNTFQYPGHKYLLAAAGERGTFTAAPLAENTDHMYHSITYLGSYDACQPGSRQRRGAKPGGVKRLMDQNN